MLLGPWRLIFWGGMAPLLPILGARMAGFEPGWLSILQLFPTVLLVVAVFLLLDIALSDTVPGAYDNASGVAAVLSAAQRLEAEPPQNLDVWVVLTGAEECLSEGMRSFVRDNRKQLDRERTVFVNVDSVSYGAVHYETSEGPVISYPLDAHWSSSARRSRPPSPRQREPRPPGALPAQHRRPPRRGPRPARDHDHRARRRPPSPLVPHPRGHPRARRGRGR